MKKRLLAVFAFGAALCFGGYVQAEEQHFMLDGERIIAEIQAKAAIIEAQGYLNQCRATSEPFWSEDENLPRMPVPAPLPVVASSPRPRATVAPVASSPVLPVPTARLEQSKPPVSTNPVAPVAIVPPVAKPPVVAAPVVEKPKAVEQAKVQVPPAKPPQPSIAPSPPAQTASSRQIKLQDDVKVCAMKIPLEKDTQIKGVLYKKGEPLWAVIRESKDGRIVDKDGRPTSEPELVSAPPRNATLVPFRAPQI